MYLIRVESYARAQERCKRVRYSVKNHTWWKLHVQIGFHIQIEFKFAEYKRRLLYIRKKFMRSCCFIKNNYIVKQKKP